MVTNEGLIFTDEIFAMKFDERELSLDFTTFEFVDEFLAETDEGMWVDVSTNSRFNEYFFDFR